MLAVAAVLGLGLTVRLWLAWMPVSWQVTHILPDDAFYYFQTARSIAHGHGITLDGTTTTNGFHPLWMMILVPVYKVADGDLAVHLSLTLAALFDTAAAALVLATARLVTRRRTLHVLALAFYALSPGTIQSAVNGMETAVSLFTTMLMVFLFVRLQTSQQDLPRGWLSFGLAGGAAVLARTDNAVILLVLLLAVPALGSRRPGLLFSARSGLVALAAVSPWFIWSSWSLGTPLQVSAEAAPYVAHASFAAQAGSGVLSPEVRHSLHFLVDVVTRLVPGALLRLRRRPSRR